jgi:hypothetical protein
MSFSNVGPAVQSAAQGGIVGGCNAAPADIPAIVEVIKRVFFERPIDIKIKELAGFSAQLTESARASQDAAELLTEKLEDIAEAIRRIQADIRFEPNIMPAAVIVDFPEIPAPAAPVVTVEASPGVCEIRAGLDVPRWATVILAGVLCALVANVALLGGVIVMLARVLGIVSIIP